MNDRKGEREGWREHGNEEEQELEIGIRGIKEEVMFQPSVEIKQLSRHIVRARGVFTVTNTY